MSANLVKPKPKLLHADILLRCAKDEHENCAIMRDSLMKSFDNITTSYTTRTMLDGIDYCVAASAIVKADELDAFKKRLQNFKGTGSNSFKVKNSEVFVNTS